MKQKYCLFSFIFLCFASLRLLGLDELEKGFRNPPNDAKPRAYFWWQNNLASREGITKDLEEIKAKGIAGVILVSAGGPAGPMPEGPIYMSPEWREMMKFTIGEAARLGIEISFNQCGGWNSGGPWITEEMGLQQYVYSEVKIKGPQKYLEKLPRPPGSPTGYRDVAVQAFRSLPSDAKETEVKITISTSGSRDDMPLKHLDDGNLRSIWGSKSLPKQVNPDWIQFNLSEPQKVDSVWLYPRYNHGAKDIEIETSEDGENFVSVTTATLKDWGEQTITFKPTLARHVRVKALNSYCAYNMQFLEVGLKPTESAIKTRHEMRAGRESVDPTDPIRYSTTINLEPSSKVLKSSYNLKDVVDLTDKLSEDGTLTWDVPEGEWTVVRSGHAPTGMRVAFAPRGGDGLEKNWLSRKATDYHFEHMTKIILEDSAEHVGKTIKYIYDDSWEAGIPNWTSEILEEFKKYRGYDPKPYLPILAGYTGTNLEVSDRFLYDFRKTIADCLAENHYAYLAQKAKERGMGMHSQAGGPCSGKLMTMDGLKNLGYCDVPMGEFWQSAAMTEGNRQSKVGKQTSSAAHIYGKRWVMGESFTSIGPHWEESPQSLKSLADIAFCEGFNRFTFHTYTSSRPEDGKPGYEYFAGTHFNRNITWWEQMGSWTGFIARTQWLLSRGLFVGDVCFYNGDWAPNLVEPKRIYPELGPGYDYDFCNADVLLNRMSVKEGRIVLPDGMSYRLLRLPDRDFMPVEVARKIKELVAAGATVVGPRPVKDPGLKNYPNSDQEVQQIAKEVWGDCDGTKVTQRTYGKGRVFWGKPIREILTADKIVPDFAYEAIKENAFIDFIHRQDGRNHIYYIANRNKRDESLKCRFRVTGLQPELWDPVSGRIRNAVAFKQGDGVTEIPLDLPEYGSMFVVFRNKISESKQGEAESNQEKIEVVSELNSTWKVTFDPKWGGPGTVEFAVLTDWTKSTENGIRYYSGTAVYEHPAFDLPSGTDTKAGDRIYIDLGNIREMGEVIINGKSMGVAWTPPFRVDITEACKPTQNRIEIKVVNLWPNRLIYEDGLSKEERLTNTNVSKFKKGMNPFPSGLLGPVKIVEVKGERD